MSEENVPDQSEVSALQKLLDIEAIKALKAKYIRLADAKNWAEWGELLTEDCQLTTDGGPQSGRENIVRVISEALKDGKTVHRVTMPEISFSGVDTASATWAMQDVVEVPHRGEVLKFNGYGYYEEDYVRTKDGWRLSRGKLVRQRVDRV